MLPILLIKRSHINQLNINIMPKLPFWSHSAQIPRKQSNSILRRHSCVALKSATTFVSLSRVLFCFVWLAVPHTRGQLHHSCNWLLDRDCHSNQVQIRKVGNRQKEQAARARYARSVYIPRIKRKAKIAQHSQGDKSQDHSMRNGGWQRAVTATPVYLMRYQA